MWLSIVIISYRLVVLITHVYIIILSGVVASDNFYVTIIPKYWLTNSKLSFCAFYTFITLLNGNQY